MKTPLLLLLGGRRTIAKKSRSRAVAVAPYPDACPAARPVPAPKRVIAQSGKTANQKQAQPAPTKPTTPPTDKNKPTRPARPDYLFM